MKHKKIIDNATFKSWVNTKPNRNELFVVLSKLTGLSATTWSLIYYGQATSARNYALLQAAIDRGEI